MLPSPLDREDDGHRSQLLVPAVPVVPVVPAYLSYPSCL